MKVKELMEWLSENDPEIEIFIPYYDDGYVRPTFIGEGYFRMRQEVYPLDSFEMCDSKTPTTSESTGTVKIKGYLISWSTR